jgi:hypothetical protein
VTTGSADWKIEHRQESRHWWSCCCRDDEGDDELGESTARKRKECKDKPTSAKNFGDDGGDKEKSQLNFLFAVVGRPGRRECTPMASGVDADPFQTKVSAEKTRMLSFD